MELTTENGSILRDPTLAQLRSTLDALGSPDNAFAVLARAEQHYLQVSGTRTDGYIVEYREGSEATHHSSASATVPHEQVVALMTAYLERSAWKPLIQWSPGMGSSRGRRRSGGKSKVSWVFAVPFLLVGLGSTAATVYQAVDTLRFRQRAVEVQGEVRELVGRKTMTAVVAYTDASGEPRETRSSWASSPPAFHVGERVTVMHDRERPVEARIRSFGEQWGGMLFSALFAVAFTGAALGVLLTGRSRWRTS